jgi:hypothetical protein
VYKIKKLKKFIEAQQWAAEAEALIMVIITTHRSLRE